MWYAVHGKCLVKSRYITKQEQKPPHKKLLYLNFTTRIIKTLTLERKLFYVQWSEKKTLQPYGGRCSWAEQKREMRGSIFVLEKLSNASVLHLERGSGHARKSPFVEIIEMLSASFASSNARFYCAAWIPKLVRLLSSAPHLKHVDEEKIIFPTSCLLFFFSAINFFPG